MDAKLRKRLDDHSAIMVDNVCSSSRQKRQAISNHHDIDEMEEMKESYINFIISPLWQEVYKRLNECDRPSTDKEGELNPRK